MPEDTNRTAIQNAWINFVKSLQNLLVPQVDDRPLDQYLAFRDTVLRLLQSEEFLKDLNTAWAPYTDQPIDEIGKALIMELQAFPLAMEVAQATSKPDEPKKWWRKMLSRGSTVSGSVHDLLDTLPPYAKGALTLFRELLDLFNGKD